MENSDDRLNLLDSAGVKKNALSGSALRRSRVGILPISPLILTSAAASVEGLPVTAAAARSAESSR